MATATTARPTVKDLAADRAAAERERASAKVAAAHAVVTRFENVADPHYSRLHDGPSASLDEVLAARAGIASARQALADAQLAERAAIRAWEQADAARREAVRDEFHRLKRPKVAAVDRAAQALRVAVDALAALEDEEQAQAGADYARQRFAAPFCGFATGSSTFSPLLDAWRRSAREHDLLDD